MTFKDNELSRYCSINNFEIPDGPKILFNYFVDKYTTESVIGYSDKRWFTGDFYKQLGFKQLEDIPPNCFYLSDNSLNRKLELPNNEFIKIFDSGSYKLIWNL